MTNFEKWKRDLTAENCESFMLAVFQQVFPTFKLSIPKEASEKFLKWANAEAVIEPVEPKGETCPKCGADTVIITRVEIRRCSKCGCPMGETR